MNIEQIIELLDKLDGYGLALTDDGLLRERLAGLGYAVADVFD